MTVNKRKTLGIAILVMGLATMMVDRVFILPKSAPAGPTDFMDNYTIARSDNIPTAMPTRQLVIPDAYRKLERAWSENDLSIDYPRDPFLIPDSWAQESGSDAGGDAPPTAAVVFIRTHKLEAIIIDPRGEYALIDGTLLRLGDEMDGFRLVAIDPESTTLQRNEERVELKLAGDQ